MKKLILVRHAKSSWENSNIKDFDRPLNSRGENNAPEMADRFLALNIIPNLILTSGAKRAYETAKIFAEKLKLTPSKLQVNNNMYHASATTLKNIIQAQNEALENIMIVGHNPGLTDLANLLGDLNIENLPTCGIYGLEIADQWKNIGNTQGKVFIFDFPKKRLRI